MSIGCLLSKVCRLVVSVLTESQWLVGLPVSVRCMTVLRLFLTLCSVMLWLVIFVRLLVACLCRV